MKSLCFFNYKKGAIIINKFIIKKAEPSDANTLLALIKELAEYEKRSDAVVISTFDLIKGIKKAYFKALLLYYQDKIAGYVVYYYNYSTFQGKRGLYIEDIYIISDFRHQGLGKKIMAYLAKTALENDCNRIDLSCLKWNKPTLKFYETLKASMVFEWHSLTLNARQLKEMIK